MLPSTGSATYSRRHLPHFERPWAKYIVTFSTRHRHMLTPAERDVVFLSLQYGHNQRQYLLYAAVVIPDHVYLLFEPQIKGDDAQGKPIFYSLAEILHSIKSSTAHRINKLRKTAGPVWDEERFDRLIRSEADLQEKFHYIVRNPWANDLVQPNEDYAWLFPLRDGRTLGRTGAPPDERNCPTTQQLRETPFTAKKKSSREIASSDANRIAPLNAPPAGEGASGDRRGACPTQDQL